MTTLTPVLPAALAVVAARYWPFVNGAGRIIDRFAHNVQIGAGERAVVTREGFTIHVLADDLIGRHLIMTGRFDGSIVDMLVQHARPGDVLVDMGANIGYVSACFMARVPNSRVVCVEPQPGIVDLLRKNMAQFGERAAVHQIALSDKDGELRFRVNVQNRGASRVSEDGEISVPAIDAAKLLAELTKVDLIKIDIEGQEANVLRAIEAELIRLKPRAILFEDATGEAGPDGAIGAVLRRAGYSVSGIEKRLMWTHLVPIASGADCRFNDYLAMPSGLSDQ